AVEVVQHRRAAAAELVIELAPAAQLADEEHQPVPDQEPLVIGHQGEEAGIVDRVDPGVQIGEEMAHGLGQDVADVQLRPRRRRSWTWPWTRARVNWLISWVRALRRLCSCTHVRTSSSRSWGT